MATTEWEGAVLAHLHALALEVVEAGNPEAPVWLLVTPTGVRHHYDVRVHDRLTAAAAGTLPRSADPALVIAPHITDAAAEVLRGRGLHFADAAGNTYLRWPDLLVDVRGRRLAGSGRGTPDGRSLRAFSPRGQRVTFSLLCEPATASAGYRTIAERCGASLGTVQAVVEELQAQGHVVGAGRARRLHQTRTLLNRWVEAYAVRASPRLVLARFDAQDPSWWRSADDDLRTDDASWGGETAAHLIDGYLRPGRTTVYARAVPRHTVIAHRLRKAAGEGDVVVREKFWNWSAQDGSHPLVPTLLVYADLVATGDPRCLEAADHLRTEDALLRALDLT